METTANSCNRIRESFADFLEMPKKLIPSHRMAAKHRCTLDSGVISLSSKHEYLISDTGKARLIENNNNTDDCEGEKSKYNRKYFSKIAGGYHKIYKIIIDQIKRRNDNVDINSIAMIDSFDGANHLETMEEKLDLVSFSSALVNKNSLDKITDSSTAKSNSILTCANASCVAHCCACVFAFQDLFVHACLRSKTCLNVFQD